MSDISIQKISKSFGRTEVLQDINIEIGRGEFITLLGASGCGKTTLLRIIAGLERPDAGAIHAGDRALVDISQKVFAAPQRRRLGYVFQDHGLWPHMSVAQNVAFPLKNAAMPNKQIRQRVGEVLEQVRLSEHAEKRPEQLSGGQKQRAGIARALAARPEILLFDEPLSSLDANLRDQLGREIRRLSKSLGLTSINVTHDRREAQILSDRIAFMKGGKLHQVGSPQELFLKPRDVSTAQFLNAGNIVPVGLLPQDARKDADTYLIPRNAIALVEQDADFLAEIVDITFIDSRYEIAARIGDNLIDFYSEASPADLDRVNLKLNRDLILPLPGN